MRCFFHHREDRRSKKKTTISQWLKTHIQFSSVTQSCLTLCGPMDCSMPGLPVHHQLPEFTQTHVHRAVMPFKHLILCCPLLFLPSIFPSIKIFSNESALCIWWPKYWSFGISPLNEYSGLIFFRIDWFDLLAVQGTLKNLLQHHNSKTSILWCSVFFIHPYMTSHIHPYMTSEKKKSLWLFGPLLAKCCLCFLICCPGLS